MAKRIWAKRFLHEPKTFSKHNRRRWRIHGKKGKPATSPTNEDARKKRRTREQVIAGISVNHVERLILKCGWKPSTTMVRLRKNKYRYSSKRPLLNNSTLTYGQLHDKLKTLSFQLRTVELDGQRGHVFLHKTINKAMITLPERNPNDVVEPFDLNSAIVNLKAHDLL